MFGLAPLLHVDVETFGGNWRKNDVKTSKSQNRHARESSYNPSCKTTFPSTGRVHGNSSRVCKKTDTCTLFPCCLCWKSDKYMYHVFILTNEPGHDKTCLREFPTRPDTNRLAQPQTLARVLKIGCRIQRYYTDAQADLCLCCLPMT